MHVQLNFDFGMNTSSMFNVLENSILDQGMLGIAQITH